ncbi:MAG: ThuA domain-containing protein, partial [Patescibacteria group bacterium]|nr:ThuA domain-containing protein [Patescibacteria group bacterium]
LPDDQMRKIVDYVNSGRPMVGLRTTTHAFRNQVGDFARWNDGFGQEVFGQRWITHHGHTATTSVFPAIASHPVLRGVEPFVGRSWLYHVTPLHGEDAQSLLLGRAIDSNKPADGPHPHIQPVAWTKTYTGDSGRTARVFFTTLGHPDEFAQPSMRRLLVNGIYWALGKEADIPDGGAIADLVGEYEAPATH